MPESCGTVPDHKSLSSSVLSTFRWPSLSATAPERGRPWCDITRHRTHALTRPDGVVNRWAPSPSFLGWLRPVRWNNCVSALCQRESRATPPEPFPPVSARAELLGRRRRPLRLSRFPAAAAAAAPARPRGLPARRKGDAGRAGNARPGRRGPCCGAARHSGGADGAADAGGQARAGASAVRKVRERELHLASIDCESDHGTLCG